MSSDHHTSPIKTPRQLITVVILAFVVPVILIVLLVTFVTGQKVGGAGSEAMTPEAIAERLRPVGSIAFASAPTGPRTLQNGEAVYKLACSAVPRIRRRRSAQGRRQRCLGASREAGL